jgi:hypothetical protein
MADALPLASTAFHTPTAQARFFRALTLHRDRLEHRIRIEGMANFNSFMVFILRINSSCCSWLISTCVTVNVQFSAWHRTNVADHFGNHQDRNHPE